MSILRNHSAYISSSVSTPPATVVSVAGFSREPYHITTCPHGVFVCVHDFCSVVSNSLRTHGLQPARLLCPWGFSRQEYWSGLPCPPPGDLPNPGIELKSPALQVDSLSAELPGKTLAFSYLRPTLLSRPSSSSTPSLKLSVLSPACSHLFYRTAPLQASSGPVIYTHRVYLTVFITFVPLFSLSKVTLP